MEIFVVIVFLLAGSMIGYAILKSLRTWMRNNASPIRTVPCVIKDKRADVWSMSGDSRTHTTYYVTFEFENGTRVELSVDDDDYGLMSADDSGILTFQGTRYKGFSRNTN